MRISSRVSSIAGAAALLLLVGAGCSAGTGGNVSAGPTSGAFVIVQASEGNAWEEGNVDKVNGSLYTVKLKSDDRLVDLPLSALAPFPTKSASVKVGDKVIAESGAYYDSGVVTAVSDSSATIAWVDGSTPSDVSLLRITTTFE